MGARAGLRDDGHRLARDEPALVALLAARAASARRSSGSTGTFRSAADPDPVGLSHRGRSTRPRTQSCCGRRRRPRRSSTSAMAVRDALALPALRRPARSAREGAAGRRRSSSSLPSCRCRERRTIRARRRSRRRSASSSGSACPSRRQTILVAGGLNRRAGQRELEALVAPASARRFHGKVAVHDAEAPDLVEVADGRRAPLHVNRLLVETDLVVCITAAETVLHGGPGALLGACGADDAACVDRLLAARDRRAPGLAARPHARACARGARARDRRVARAQPAAAAGPLPRLPVRGRVAQAPRRLAAAPVLAPPLRSAPPDPPGPRARAHRGRRVRGAARRSRTPRRSLRGIARRSTPLDAAARRARDRDAVEAPPLAARAAEPDHGRDRRARAGAAALARRVPGRRRRHRDRAPPALAPFPAQHAGSLSLALPRAPRRPRPRPSSPTRSRRRDGRARARRLPGRPRLPPAPALRRLGGLHARARPARRRA